MVLHVYYDLDGTIWPRTHKWVRGCPEVEKVPYPGAVHALRKLDSHRGVVLIPWTGRPEESRECTEQSLRKFEVPHHRPPQMLDKLWKDDADLARKKMANVTTPPETTLIISDDPPVNHLARKMGYRVIDAESRDWVHISAEVEAAVADMCPTCVQAA